MFMTLNPGAFCIHNPMLAQLLRGIAETLKCQGVLAADFSVTQFRLMAAQGKPSWHIDRTPATEAIWIEFLSGLSGQFDCVWTPELKSAAMQYGCVPPTKRQLGVSGPVAHIMALAMSEL